MGRNSVKTSKKFYDINSTLKTKEVELFKNGKTKLLGFFVGQLMKRTKGKLTLNLQINFFQKN